MFFCTYFFWIRPCHARCTQSLSSEYNMFKPQSIGLKEDNQCQTQHTFPYGYKSPKSDTRHMFNKVYPILEMLIKNNLCTSCKTLRELNMYGWMCTATKRGLKFDESMSLVMKHVNHKRVFISRSYPLEVNDFYSTRCLQLLWVHIGNSQWSVCNFLS